MHFFRRRQTPLGKDAGTAVSDSPAVTATQPLGPARVLNTTRFPSGSTTPTPQDLRANPNISYQANKPERQPGQPPWEGWGGVEREGRGGAHRRP
jgi:hypothetical protein